MILESFTKINMNDYSGAFQPDFSQSMQPQQAPQAPQAPQGSQYPALPNAYGLGQVQQPQAQPQPMNKQGGQETMGSYLNGANPWDFQGASNIR